MTNFQNATDMSNFLSNQYAQMYKQVVGDFIRQIQAHAPKLAFHIDTWMSEQTDCTYNQAHRISVNFEDSEGILSFTHDGRMYEAYFPMIFVTDGKKNTWNNRESGRWYKYRTFFNSTITWTPKLVADEVLKLAELRARKIELAHKNGRKVTN